MLLVKDGLAEACSTYREEELLAIFLLENLKAPSLVLNNNIRTTFVSLNNSVVLFLSCGDISHRLVFKMEDKILILYVNLN